VGSLITSFIITSNIIYIIFIGIILKDWLREDRRHN
jgi:hypothetical protein